MEHADKRRTNIPLILVAIGAALLIALSISALGGTNAGAQTTAPGAQYAPVQQSTTTPSPGDGAATPSQDGTTPDGRHCHHGEDGGGSGAGTGSGESQQAPSTEAPATTNPDV